MNASKSLKQAADIIGLQPAALQLRYSNHFFVTKLFSVKSSFLKMLRNIWYIYVGDVLDEFLSLTSDVNSSTGSNYQKSLAFVSTLLEWVSGDHGRLNKSQTGPNSRLDFYRDLKSRLLGFLCLNLLIEFDQINLISYSNQCPPFWGRRSCPDLVDHDVRYLFGSMELTG